MEKTNPLLHKSVITPFTVISFLIISITGIQMFLGIRNHFVSGLHEWVGLAFVLFGVLHLVVNWKVFLTYIRKPLTIVLLVLTIGATPFLFIGGQERGHGGEGRGMGMGRGNPMREISMYLEKAPLAHVIPLFDLDEKKAIEILKTNGIQISNGEQTLAEIAQANDKPFFEILAVFAQANG